MRLKSLIVAAALTALAGAAQAATVQFSLIVGNVQEANNTLVHDFTDFQLNDVVTMLIEVDDAVLDSNASNGVGIWDDPTGTIRLTSSSGGDVLLSTGVRIKAQAFNGYITISGDQTGANPAEPIVMARSNGVVFGTTSGYTDSAIAGGGNPLSSLLALLPIPPGNSVFVDIDSTVTTDNPAGDETGLVIGPVPVPLPAGGLLLVGALGALAYSRRRKAA